jgi:hypothetical protein
MSKWVTIDSNKVENCFSSIDGLSYSVSQSSKSNGFLRPLYGCLSRVQDFSFPFSCSSVKRSRSRSS